MKIWPQMHHGNSSSLMPHVLHSSDSYQCSKNNINPKNNHIKSNYDQKIFKSNCNNQKDYSQFLWWPLSPSITKRIKSLCSLKTLYQGHQADTQITANYSHDTTMRLRKVTGPPTRVHWKPDLFSAHCDLTSALCTTPFTTFRRRHHCRRCGLIFCHLHSLYSAPLDQDANFHLHGRIVRVCENCWHQWEKWVEACSLTPSSPTKTQNSDIFTENNAKLEIPPGDLYSISPNSFDSKATTLSTPISVPENHLQPVSEIDLTGQSVPHYWHWSTF